MNLRCALPRNPNTRVSPDSAWPLRGADGLTYAERKRRNELLAKTPVRGDVA